VIASAAAVRRQRDWAKEFLDNSITPRTRRSVQSQSSNLLLFIGDSAVKADEAFRATLNERPSLYLATQKEGERKRERERNTSRATKRARCKSERISRKRLGKPPRASRDSPARDRRERGEEEEGGGRESVRTRRARSAVTVTDRGTRSFPERSRRTHGTVCRLSSLDVRPIARLAASGSARDVTNAVTASRASFPRRGGREGGCAHGAVAGAPRRARFVLPTISRQLSNCAGTQLIMRPREIGAR